jgi:hypothetical protein
MSLVTIRNKQTGEVKQVDSSELSNYGVGTSKTTEKKNILQGNTLPVAGGILGGTVGSLLGGLPGVGGAAAGYAGADVLRKSLADLLGIDISGRSTEAVGDIGQTMAGAGTSAIAQALGEGVAKAAGFVAHPIKSVTNKMVVEPLKKLATTIDIGDVLSTLFQKGNQQFAKNVMSSEFSPAYNTLASDVASSVANLVPHEAAQNVAPGVAQTMGDVASMSLPISEANLLKSNLQRGVSEFYGERGPAIVELRKLLASVLKQEIEQKAPASVGVGNKIASLMYGLPDTMTGLTYALPWAAGRSVRAAAGVPIKLSQFLLSNPATQKLIPALSQLLTNSGENQ